MNDFQKNLIIQIYGRNDYKKINYHINGNQFEKKLISEAWYEHLGNGDIIFLIPESLLINEISNYEEYERFLKNKNEFENYFKNKIELQYENNDLIKNTKVLKLQSIGFYSNPKFKDINIDFQNNTDNIEIYLFRELFDDLEKHDKIIIDTSTGLNYYITLIYDVIKNYIIYNKLRNYLNSNKKKSFILSILPPILQTTENIKIEQVDFDVKTIFEMSSKSSSYKLIFDETSEIKEKINKKIEKHFDQINKIFIETKKGFNALKFNIPLSFTSDKIFKTNFEYKDSIDILNKIIFKILDDLEKSMKLDRGDNKLKVSRYKIKKESFFDLINNLAIYENIKIIKDKIGDAELENIKNKFFDIYDKMDLDLNKRFLERDLKEIENYKNEIGNNYQYLNEIIFKNKEVYKILNKTSSDQKRNFFAHSGLEYTFTLVKKEDNKIFLKYDESKIELIKKWIVSLK